MDNEYQKHFDEWGKKKEEIHNTGREPYFYEGEIWWCSLGVNIGTEEDGKNSQFERPVLVISKINARTAIVVPLSSKMLLNNLYRVDIKSVHSQAVLSQIRTVSAYRFLRRVIKINVT